MKTPQASAKPTAKGATPVGARSSVATEVTTDDQDEGDEDLHQQRPDIPDVLRRERGRDVGDSSRCGPVAGSD